MALVNVAAKLPRGDFTMRFELDPSRPTDGVILGYLEQGSMYEPDVSQVFTRAIQPGDTVLDVGANIGIFSVLAARLVGPTGSVVGFEPGPDNLERLAVNLALNDAGNVTIVDRPASNRIENVTFHLNSDNQGGHSLWKPGDHPLYPKSREDARSIAATTTTIDAEVARLGLAPPRLIKIDTEGAEHRVLQGAAGLLAEFEIPYIVAELHEFGLARLGSSQEQLRGFMADLGYETFLLYVDGALPKLVPRGTRIESPYFVNILFSTPEHVAALWLVETHDPRTRAPAEPAACWNTEAIVEPGQSS